MRSIGVRSDQDDGQATVENSVADHDEADEEQLRAREEANSHIANYVSTQLERIRSHDLTINTSREDEFEAQLDG